MGRRRWLAQGWALLAVCVVLCGCRNLPWRPQNDREAQYKKLQADYDAKVSELQNLHIKTQHMERQLARLETQLSQREPAATVARHETPVPEMLPGETHLASLARRDPRLSFDPGLGMAKFSKHVEFASGRCELTPDARTALQQLAEVLLTKSGRTLNVMVVGHADDASTLSGPDRAKYPSDWHLSSARALTVVDALIQSGVAEPRLGLAGYGAQQPLAQPSRPEDHLRNRRVEIFLLEPDTPVVGRTETIAPLY